MSTTEHTPAPVPMPAIRRQPTWIYDLPTRRWRTFENGGRTGPTFFGGASAYDERRGVLVAYGRSLWELDIEAGVWRKASPEAHHDMHHTMVYDQRRGALFVFGDYRPTNTVWSYLPGAVAGANGHWTAHRPKADPCPPLSSVPVAYDAEQGVFVLVVSDTGPATPAQPSSSGASTYLYDPGADACKRLAGADLPSVGMNYMMAWDGVHDVVFLVAGDWHGTVTVWAMKPQK
jgi:hypothetical protein